MPGVLIVEDERTIAENLYDYLEAGGYRCDYAASLAEAAARCRAGKYAVLLVDRNLPDGDGAQWVRSLREQGVLLVGSGSITHNLGELNWRAGPEVITPWAGEFRDWMVEHLRQDDRVALLDYRRQAPHAVQNHPSDEHLLPLFFALGAGEQFGLVHSGFTYGALGMDVYRFD